MRGHLLCNIFAQALSHKMTFTLQGGKQTLSIKQPKCNEDRITHFTCLHGTSIRTLYTLSSCCCPEEESSSPSHHTRANSRGNKHIAHGVLQKLLEWTLGIAAQFSPLGVRHTSMVNSALISAYQARS